MKTAVVSVLLVSSVLMTACDGSDLTVVPAQQDGARTAKSILPAVPTDPDVNASYIIYLHGAIVETGGMRPTDPRFGEYQYAKILQTFADRGFTVISEARAAGTRPDVFAQRVASQVRQLLDAGVPEDHITVVGFSKGGVIATIASREVHNPGVSWVLQASCGPWLDKMPELVPHGRILSLYDRSDDLAGSCRSLFDRMPDDAITREQVLDLDTAHGAVYRPDPSWVEATIAWAGR